MRPYIAIIKDSFREALHSRVLWVMLILITLLLLLIVPISYDDQKMTTDLMPIDFLEWSSGIGPAGMLVHVATEGESDKPSPARRVWTLLDDELKEDVREFDEVHPETRAELEEMQQDFAKVLARFVENLNDVIQRDDFYEEASWKEVEPNVELQELMDLPIDEIESEEQLRKNRLLLEAGFPQFIRESPPRSIVLTYAGIELTGAIPVAPQQFQETVASFFLTWVILVFCSLGVLVAILVTAPIIPQTFDTGSLNLLLSKPVSRWKLFLAQYLGGCSFILLAMTYLFVGFWIILGSRLGIWDPKLLYYIPGFMFIFAIYYAVSALAGVIWRSTIVAAVVCILFYCLCWTFDVSKWGIELFMNPYHIDNVIPVGDSVVVVNRGDEVRRWSDRKNSWDIIFRTEAEERNPFATVGVAQGPVYDAKGDQLVAVNGSVFRPEGMLSVGKREKKWRRTSGAQLPGFPSEILQEPDGDVLLVTFSGVYRGFGDLSIPPLLEGDTGLENSTKGRFDSDSETVPSGGSPQDDDDPKGDDQRSEKDPSSDDDCDDVDQSDDKADQGQDAPGKDDSKQAEEKSDSGTSSDSKSSEEAISKEPQGDVTDQPTTAKDEPDLPVSGFMDVAPLQQLRLNRPHAFAMNGSKEELAIYSRGHIEFFRSDELGFYEKQGEIDMEGADELATMAFGGKALVVGRSDGIVTLFDTSDLASVAKKKEHKLEGKVQPRFVAGSASGGWFAITFHNGNLWLLNNENGDVARAPVAGQGSISAIRFIDDKSLLVTDSWTRVSQYSLDPLKLEKRYAPNLTAFEKAYRYVVVPLYTVFPKPRLINNVVEYFITGDETQATWAQTWAQWFGLGGIEDARVQLRPWATIWSGLLFIGVVLGFGCFYFTRQDF